MPYPIPTLSTLLQDAQNDLTADGTVVLPISILSKLADNNAGFAFELFAYLSYISKQSIPSTSSGEYLDNWSNLKGAYRTPAVAATSTAVSFTGTVFNPVTPPVLTAGTLLATQAGTQYQTTQDFTLGTTTSVPITAVIPGAAGNAPAGIALSLQTPILGVNSVVTVLEPIAGGADQMTDPVLRNLMLQAYQNPPQGGADSDYILWSEKVPGVTRAWTNTTGVTPGSVQVLVMFDEAESANGGFPVGSNGGASLESRIPPATGDQLIVANYIYPLRPVTALVQVVAPVPAPINFTIQSLMPSNATIEAGIIAALQDMFVRLGSPLAGNIIYPSSVNQSIESVAGIGVYTLVSPTGPIQVSVGALPVVGQVSFT